MPRLPQVPLHTQTRSLGHYVDCYENLTLGTGRKAWQSQCLLCKYEELSLDPQHLLLKEAHSSTAVTSALEEGWSQEDPGGLLAPVSVRDLTSKHKVERN